MALIFIVPIYLILYASFHLYVPKRIQGRRSELANICKANVIGLMLFTFVLFWPAKVRKPSELFLHKDDSGILCGQYHPAGSRADINTHLPALPADQRL